MNQPQPVAYDRSRTTTDWECPRKRFLGYELYGRGITTSNEALELVMGSALHTGLAGIAQGEGIDQLVEEARTTIREYVLKEATADQEHFTNEQQALVEGLLRGYHTHVWPRLTELYPKVRLVEQELLYYHNYDGEPAGSEPYMIFMSKPDLVVQTAEGENVYIEFKSTSSKREEWVNSWNTAIQLHSSIRAIEAALGEPVQQVLVQGLYKGYIDAYKKQSSPFCYAYAKSVNPPFQAGEISYIYKAGLKRAPTWEMTGGVKAWVEGMPEHILADQFPQSPPIMVKNDLVDAFFRQRVMREQEIDVAARGINEGSGQSQYLLDIAFPQRFDKCVPGFGRPCMFRQVCHGGMTQPLEHGYQLRVPHHLLELERQETIDHQQEATA